MSDPHTQFNASIERMNAIAAKGNLKSVHGSLTYRRELKKALRALRQVIAAEPDPETRRLFEQMLGTLKRLHYRLMRLEDCTIAITFGQN